MGAFVADGRLRSGWVLLVYVAVAALALGLFSVPLGGLGLLPTERTTVEDPRVLFNSMLVLAGAASGTLVCALGFQAEVGLRDPRWARRLGWGALMGALAVSLAAGLPVVLGHGALQLNPAGAGAVLKGGLLQLLFLAPTGVGEELLVRGVPLKELTRGTHAAVAVFLTGAVFGLLHLWNPSATWVSTFNVALVGWWFGAVAVRTRTLWAPIGMHVAWNFFEGFVFGQPVSGVTPAGGLVVASWAPRGFWSGGDFGPEASGLTAVVLAAGLALTMLWPSRKARTFENSPPGTKFPADFTP
jgi:membrane protease YdiL (CAAX protease family)